MWMLPTTESDCFKHSQHSRKSYSTKNSTTQKKQSLLESPCRSMAPWAPVVRQDQIVSRFLDVVRSSTHRPVKSVALCLYMLTCKYKIMQVPFSSQLHSSARLDWIKEKQVSLLLVFLFTDVLEELWALKTWLSVVSDLKVPKSWPVKAALRC